MFQFIYTCNQRTLWIRHEMGTKATRENPSVSFGVPRGAWHFAWMAQPQTGLPKRRYHEPLASS